MVESVSSSSPLQVSSTTPLEPRACLLVAEGQTAAFFLERSRMDDHVTEMSFAASASTQAHVALVAIRSRVTYIAVIMHEARVDEVHRLFDLVGLQLLREPLPFDAFAAVLTKQQQGPLSEHGGGSTFGPKASKAVLGVLEKHDPAAYTAVKRHLRPASSGTPSQKLRRDATVDSLAFTGAGSEMGEVDVAPKEFDLIVRDASTFLGWTSGFTDTVKVRQFKDSHNRTLKVMITDHDRFETDLGPDLLYYHQQRDSFVLVQYKRMTGAGQNMSYSANKQLDRQLEAMTHWDARCAAAGQGEAFRLIGTPSFVKICRQESPALDELALVSGLCMPREQVVAYLQRTRTFSYESIKDCLTSTDFAKMVALGLFGSTPAGSTVIREELKRHYGPTVYAQFSDESNRRPGGRSRTSSRRSAPPAVGPSSEVIRGANSRKPSPSKMPDAQQEELFAL